MKKDKALQSNMPGVVSEALFPQPAKPDQSGNEKPLKQRIKSDSPPKSSKTADVDFSLIAEEKQKTKANAPAKKVRVVIYCAEENYASFEKAFSEAKSQFRMQTGKKMAETHFAEIAMMTGVEMFLKQPETFVSQIAGQNKTK